MKSTNIKPNQVNSIVAYYRKVGDVQMFEKTLNAMKLNTILPT